MSHPEEFTIHIEPDGRIVMDIRGMQETSYRRILDLLEETVGPAQVLEAGQGDPPRRRLAPRTDQRERPHQRLDRKP